MKIIIKTPIAKNYLEVFEGFTQDLFDFLAPKGQLNVLKFDGSRKGDEIELEFLKPTKGYWKSIITEDGQDETKAYFIDEGVVLPLGLGTWKHQHIVEKVDEHNCIIIDEIDYTAKFKPFTPFLYLPLYFAFAPRKKKYQEFFKD